MNDFHKYVALTIINFNIKVNHATVYGSPAIICLVFYMPVLFFPLQTRCQSSIFLSRFLSTKKVVSQFHLLEEIFSAVIEPLQWPGRIALYSRCILVPPPSITQAIPWISPSALGP